MNLSFCSTCFPLLLDYFSIKKRKNKEYVKL